MENKKTVNLDMKQYGMVIALIAIFLLFYVLSGGKNASATNINNLIMQNGYVVILAVGMLLCVLTGNIDLGVGSVVALSGAAAAILTIDMKLPVPVAFLAALAVGLISGIFVGFFVAYLDIPPFVVTLATMLMGRGLTYTILKAQTKGPLQPDYTWVGAGFLPTIKVPFGNGTIDLICILVATIASILLILSEIKNINTKKKYGFATNPTWQVVLKIVVILAIIWFFFFKIATYNGIPYVLLLMGVLVGVYHFVTSKTVAGRQIYALGGNAKAARLSGIDTRKVFFWVYTNMGILAAVAGIVLSARNASATPKAGDGFELDAIGSCYIGGAAAAGGVGTIMGAVVGAFIMGILNNGMSLIGWSTDIQKVVKGIVLLGAVTVDVLSKRKKA
ncbi:multiple monosaccharide ABC transporter permease [Candidatus Galacturonibacter soehngenii]|uniref:Xylose transport system permease protein XylH n=1 Tax=Candidatus Galacturonatibacter soehngenii TaxID=2307010 RepID=A0A7V7QHZ2_9FIRM|nr:multiple monosaccharide ABC transporter permease [Candidatus Galacturonibacter soehngenii]KAB1435737.1 sugar ABC transporter permease [Candidatus Galacturonibacter soehngenii]MBA4688884.1 sugar ABC transporter permease [Candidatus Galacturonibacter soehngenii]